MDPLLALTLALGLAALLAASAWHQLARPHEWLSVVRNYQLLAPALSAPAAAGVIVGELIVAAGLMWPPARTRAGVACAALLGLFAVAMWINIRRGRTEIDCGCFGSRSTQGIAPWMVWRNIVLGACSLALALPRGARELSALDLVVCVGCVATLGFLYPAVAVVLRTAPPADLARRGAAARRGS